MKVKCKCGFQGTLREENGYGKCFGCDQLYVELNGKVQEMPNKIPEFKSWKEMQKFLDQTPKEGKVVTKKRPPRKKKPAEVDSSSTLTKEKPDVPVYKTLHFYLRPGDTWDQLLKDGREEVNYAGPGTLVFVHQHFHSEDCNEMCRGMS